MRAPGRRARACARRAPRGPRRPESRQSGVQSREGASRRPREPRGLSQAPPPREHVSRTAVPTAMRRTPFRSPTSRRAHFAAPRGFGLADELLDGVPPVLELDRIERRSRDRLRSARAPIACASIQKARTGGGRGSPSDDSKSSTWRRGRVEPHPLSKRSGSGRSACGSPRGASRRRRRAPLRRLPGDGVQPATVSAGASARTRPNIPPGAARPRRPSGREGRSPRAGAPPRPEEPEDFGQPTGGSLPHGSGGREIEESEPPLVFGGRECRDQH